MLPDMHWISTILAEVRQGFQAFLFQTLLFRCMEDRIENAFQQIIKCVEANPTIGLDSACIFSDVQRRGPRLPQGEWVHGAL